MRKETFSPGTRATLQDIVGGLQTTEEEIEEISQLLTTLRIHHMTQKIRLSSLLEEDMAS